MHSFMAVAVVARFILLTVHSRGAIAAAAPGTETINTLGHADATFLHTDEDERLLAAIVGAHIFEPDRVAGVLNELRIESTGHLGRLDLEEWSEMMAEMRSGGIALGSRNKLRLLVAARYKTAGAWPTWADGPRRVQELQAEESSSRTDQKGDSTSAAEQASQQESANEPTGTIFGVSGDGAPRPPQSDYCGRTFMYCSFAQGVPRCWH